MNSDSVPAATASPDLSHIADRAGVGAIHVVLGVLLVALVVVARWCMLSRFGTDAPFWDQWDSEIAALYKPFVDGSMHFAQLFAPHNEHRILFSRVLNLGLFSANGNQFDNLVETFANAVVYAFVLLLCAWPVLVRLRGPGLLLGWILTLGVGIAPYGWENLLLGFQNAFYFMNGFAALGIALAAFGNGRPAMAFSLVAALASLFTLASGLLIAPVLAAIWLLRAACGQVPHKPAWIAAGTSIAIGAIGVLLLPPIAVHAGLKAQGATDLLSALICAISWPLLPSVVGAALLWWPAAALAWRLRRREAQPIDVYLLGLCAWTLLQAAAIAWSRGHDMVIVSSRYSDTLVLGPLASLAIAVRLLATAGRNPRGRSIVAAVSLAALVCLGALSAQSLKGFAVMSRHAQTAAQSRANLHAYIAGAGRSAFEGKSGKEISYPQAERLGLLLDDETVLGMMPASIRRALPSRYVSCGGFEFPGVEPPVEPLPDALGSFTAAQGNEAAGECSGQLPASRWPYLLIRVAGQPGDPGISFAVGAGPRSVVTATLVAGMQWSPIVFAAGATQWTATDRNAAAWIAFTPPVEIGRLTMLVQRIVPWLRLTRALD